MDNSDENKRFIAMNRINLDKAKDNYIRTSKYTALSFVPMFLFEQYKQFNNIYYLANAIAGFIVYVVSPVTNVFPIVFIFIISACREILEDYSRHKADKEQNSKQYHIIRNTERQIVSARDIRQGDILEIRNHEEIPCDSVLLKVESESGLCYISTSNLDGEVNLKLKRAALRDEAVDINNFQSVIVVDPPSKNMHVMNGEIRDEDEIQYFKFENVLLRGTRQENTSLTYLGVIYTGMDTRVMQQEIKSDQKTSKMNQRINKIVMYLGMISVLLMIVFPIISYFKWADYKSSFISFACEPSTQANSFLEKLIVFFILLAYLLPLSLFVCLEFSRVINVIHVESDKKLRRDDVLDWQTKNLKKKLSESPFSSESQYARSVTVKNSIAVENLAEVDIIFSDKTGTLTKNLMLFHSYSDDTNEITNVARQIKQYQESDYCSPGQFTSEIDIKMLISMALCNTVLNQDVMDLINGQVVVKTEYQGESPDEIAFVNAAKLYGFTLVKRLRDSVLFDLRYKGVIYRVAFEVLAIIPFSSARKRMSAIFKEIGQPYQINHEILLENEMASKHDGRMYFLPKVVATPGESFVLSKGADSSMMPLCKITTNQFFQKANDNIKAFSVKGLRTLVFASRSFNISGWVDDWRRISLLDENHQEYAQHTDILERDFRFTGVTAIEDELQDNVKETLLNMLQSGQKLWMLTGDKTETAINISKSSGIASPFAQVLELTYEKVEQQINANREALKMSHLQASLEVSYQDLDKVHQDAMSTFEDERREAVKQLLLKLIVTQKNSISKRQRENYETVQTGIQKIADRSESCCARFWRFLGVLFAAKSLNYKYENQAAMKLTTLVLESRVFNLITKYGYQPLLCTLAYHATSAVCCRLSPTEKAQIVEMITKYVPKMTTMSIGDGANDVAMIKAAQIGVGVAGKEGLHSCNSADITLPSFKYLKRLMFVHGRYCHLRNQELTEYMIEKNTILGIMHIVYAFYNLFTVQLLIDSLILSLFNFAISLFPIMFSAITEQDVYSTVLDRSPVLSKRFDRFRPTSSAMGLRLLRSLYYSLALIMVGRYLYLNGMNYANGSVTDLNVQSFTTFSSLLVSTSFEYLLRMNFYTFFTVLAFVAMFVITILITWMITFSSWMSTITIGVGYQLSWNFSVQVAITALVCSLPSILIAVVRRLWWPEAADISRKQYRISGCIDPKE